MTVSPAGKDEPQCTRKSTNTSCKSIGYAIKQGFSSLCMHGTNYNTSEYIELYHSVYQQNQTNIFCKEFLSEDNDISFLCEATKMCNISLHGCRMKKSTIRLSNVKITFVNAVIEQTLIQDSPSLSESYYNEIHFTNCTLSCFDSTDRCGLHLDNSSAAKVVFINSYFTSFRINIFVSQLIVKFYKSHIIMPAITIKVRSLEYLRIPTFIQFNNVTVIKKKIILKREILSTEKENVKAKHQDYLIILDVTNPYIIIKQSYFSDIHLEIQSNRRKFALMFLWLLIEESSFIDSYHIGNGGALTIISQSQSSQVKIIDCLFSNNSAVKGLGSLKGRGGGLYIEVNSLSLIMTGCNFVENSASDSGLALFTSEGVDVSCKNCTFQYSVKPHDPIQQSILFVAGKLIELHGLFTVFIPKPESFVGPIDVFYIEQCEKIYIETFCPKWYDHDIEYSSDHTKRQAHYKCIPCSDNYYTRSVQTNTIYFNRKENITLVDRLTEVWKESCIQCPYGALCTGNNVMPRPNYWGFWYEGKLHFHQCPAGYCCSGSDSSTCNRYDYCPGNRTDTLCGACQEGFSVSILTWSCISDDLCGGDQWFWLIVVLAAMAYALWYTFKDDVLTLFCFSIKFLKGVSAGSVSNRNNGNVQLVRHQSLMLQ